jgi:hypothetical protein
VLPSVGFPDFPPEIRSLIWEFALKAPQVHIIGYDLVSFSKVNYVMQECKEARDGCQKLMISYHQISTASQFEEPEWKMENVKIFINVDVDIIWLDAVYQLNTASTARRDSYVIVSGFIEFS